MTSFINNLLTADLIVSTAAICVMFVRFVLIESGKEVVRRSVREVIEEMIESEEVISYQQDGETVEEKITYVKVSESETVEESVTEESEVENEVPNLPVMDDLDNYGIRELRPIAKDYGIKGFMKMNKATLIQSIRNLNKGK